MPGFKMMILTVLMTIHAIGHATDMTKLDHEWLIFKSNHSKIYKSQSEDTFRQKIWLENLARIEKHNMEARMGKHTYTMGMNQFGDWTAQDFESNTADVHSLSKRSVRCGSRMSCSCPSNIRHGSEMKVTGKSIPDKFDWRKKKAVTPVKNQGQYGTCYSFAAVAAVEGQHARAKKGKLVSLSAQEIVDCSQAYGNNGCINGSALRSFRYIHAAGGIATEEDYPYKGDNGDCKANKFPRVAKVGHWTYVPYGNENALKEAVAKKGPIAVSVRVPRSFMQYRGGVFYTDECGEESANMSHAMVVVGYGKDRVSHRDYWIVKNSYGDQWGKGGYIWMARNRNNHCGIANFALYPAKGATPRMSIVLVVFATFIPLQVLVTQIAG